jgi:hypothetical protein
MTEALKTAVARLAALPEADQERLGEQINVYLTKLERLRAMVDDPRASEARPFDLDRIAARGREKAQEQNEVVA